MGGTVIDRTRGVWPILASRLASTMAENRAESNAGTLGKVLRSVDDGDATIPDARWAASMATPATGRGAVSSGGIGGGHLGLFARAVAVVARAVVVDVGRW